MISSLQTALAYAPLREFQQHQITFCEKTISFILIVCCHSKTITLYNTMSYIQFLTY